MTITYDVEDYGKWYRIKINYNGQLDNTQGEIKIEMKKQIENNERSR
jgi:hypothetical protein